MTKQEKIIVSAYTGYLMCDVSDVHKYVEELLGRPVWTHELSCEHVQREIMEKAKPDFLKLCEKTDEVKNDSKYGFVKGDTDKKLLPKGLIYEGYSKEDGDTTYRCPYCDKKIGGWIVRAQKETSDKVHCPFCEKHVAVVERI